MNPNENEFNPLPENSSYSVKQPPQNINPLAVVSLIFGILSWIFLPFIGALIAIITGHIACRQPQQNEQGVARAGLILGYLQLLLTILLLALLAVPLYSAYQENNSSEAAYALIEPQRLNLMLPEYADAQTVALSQEAQQYWQNVSIENHMITAQFGSGEKVAGDLKNVVLQIEAVTDENGVTVWHCRSETLRSVLFPDYCESNEEETE